jgi:ribosomal protein S18 acetylase RimI-like enzyme
MPSIVRMTADRFAAMDKIDVEAWSNWASKKFGRAIQFPSKARVYGTYLDGDPEGGFVALDDSGKPVGYIFTRTFGKVGFFGPFGVVPSYQGAAVGKALVRATIDYMERSGCTTIGLETMPETAYNLGLYTKLGFRLFSLTLRMQKSIAPGAKGLPSNVRAVGEPDNKLLEDVRRISSTLEDGLDFSKEVALLRKYPIGTCLTYEKDGQVCGFALCYMFNETVGLYPASDANDVRVRILALDAHRCGLDDAAILIGACEAHGRSLNRITITIPIYAEYYSALIKLYQLGYRVHDDYPSLVKLAQRDYHISHPDAVCLNEWAG